MEALFASLKKRLRPEDIAEMILKVLDPLTSVETNLLKQVSKHSISRGLFLATSMMQSFREPVVPHKQVNRAQELFTSAYKVDATDAEAVLKLIKHISNEIRKTFSENDFIDDRLNREDRLLNGLDISRRRYNKLFRFLARFEKKLNTYILEQKKFDATLISKSSLASKITKSDFFASTNAACFIAYYVARCNRRSMFTNTSQDKSFDKLSKMLLDRFKANPCREGWRAIAHVMPDIEVIKNLHDDDKFQLYTKWLEILADVADLLKQTWRVSQFDRMTMIVNRGDDSSTWNILAGAWNSARKSYISLLFALGLEEQLENVCFGKVMRLMAADVVMWHRSSGGNLDPDTQVWANLPAPWEVFTENATCTKSTVQLTCEKFKVDPIAKGWIAPVSNRKPVEFKPTPELVHGVAISNPKLATVLRKAGWFSGKKATSINEDVHVERDDYGAVIDVSEVNDCSV